MGTGLSSGADAVRSSSLFRRLRYHCAVPRPGYDCAVTRSPGDKLYLSSASPAAAAGAEAASAGAAGAGVGAGALDATAILARTSRLVIDPNRDPADPTSIPEISDRIRIPANCDLNTDERARRPDAYFLPYHDAIEREIERLRAHRTAPAIFS